MLSMLGGCEWLCSVGRMVPPLRCRGVVGAVALACQLSAWVLSLGWVRCLVLIYYSYFRTKLSFILTMF